MTVPGPPAVSEGTGAAAASAAAAGADAAATASALSARFLKEWEAAGCPGRPSPASTAAGQKGKRTFDHAMATHSLCTRHADGAAAAAGAATAGKGNGAAAAAGGARRGSPMVESKGTFAKKLRKASLVHRCVFLVAVYGGEILLSLLLAKCWEGRFCACFVAVW